MRVLWFLFLALSCLLPLQARINEEAASLPLPLLTDTELLELLQELEKDLAGLQKDLVNTESVIVQETIVPPSPQSLPFFTYYNDGQFDKALTEILKQLNNSPTNADLLFFTARIYSQLGQYDNAIDYYLKLNAVNPLYPTLNNHLALLYYQLKNYRKALYYCYFILQNFNIRQTAELSMVERKRLSQTYRLAGDSFFMLNNREKAFQCYQLAYWINQLDVLAVMRVAIGFLTLRDDPVTAKQLMDRAIELKNSLQVREFYEKLNFELRQ